MTNPINPADVETSIRDIVNEIALGVRTVSDALGAFRDAERAYDLAFARSYMRYDGPAHAKRYAAEIDTTAERAKRDAAEVAWKYAERISKSQETELSAWQTIAKSIVSMYGATRA